MKRILTCLILLGTNAGLLFCQCTTKFDLELQAGDRFYSEGNYYEAIRNYRSALEPPDAKLPVGGHDLIETRIQKVFKTIDLTEYAAKWTRDSLDSIIGSNNKLIARLTNDVSILRQEGERLSSLVAEKEKIVEETTIQLADNEAYLSKILKSLYFYMDSVALFCNKNGLFGYMNPRGDCIHTPIFQSATVFEFPGYAKVTKTDGKAYILDMSMNSLPAAFSEEQLLDNTKAVDIRNLKLPEIPKFAVNQVGLKIILLSRNRLTSLPSNFASASTLEVLDISSNYFSKFPREQILQFKNLKKLYLNGNSCVGGKTDRENILHEIGKALPNCEVIF